ncbi:hypothetical protein CA85_49980 [Allorhodopirellula solitaria]|uniref:Uncharacterized protein n=1 Tax=Allorhodopirellula solitaria TaxID=2527987 RepID=A0A5C5WW89_9BACT|nr:hypothetical protein CA85_49980 [Allorhodopirellula solitaria]
MSNHPLAHPCYDAHARVFGHNLRTATRELSLFACGEGPSARIHDLRRISAGTFTTGSGRHRVRFLGISSPGKYPNGTEEYPKSSCLSAIDCIELQTPKMLLISRHAYMQKRDSRLSRVRTVDPEVAGSSPVRVASSKNRVSKFATAVFSVSPRSDSPGPIAQVEDPRIGSCVPPQPILERFQRRAVGKRSDTYG